MRYIYNKNLSLNEIFKDLEKKGITEIKSFKNYLDYVEVLI